MRKLAVVVGVVALAAAWRERAIRANAARFGLPDGPARPAPAA